MPFFTSILNSFSCSKLLYMLSHREVLPAILFSTSANRVAYTKYVTNATQKNPQKEQSPNLNSAPSPRVKSYTKA